LPNQTEHSTEHSEDSGTLPAPELNPLLNPVLGQNMGRWAEVYFTNPPEKREQAVLELLRELEAKEPAQDDQSGATPAWPQESLARPVTTPMQPENIQPMPIKVRCRTCGRELPASQKYCGMCGARQAVAETIAPLEVASFQPVVEDRQTQPAPQGWRESQPSAAARDSYEPRLPRNEFSLFQTADTADYHDDGDDEIFSYAAPTRSYRVYIGTVLAIVILALGYMAWRSAQATSQTAHVESQAPPPVATQAAPATPEAAPTTSQPEAADRKATADKEPVSAAPGAADGSSAPKPRSAEKTSPVEKPNAASDAEKWTQLNTEAGNGSQELAMALRYLNGVEGERVNKAEAAKWLWKAMAKHNGAATLLLADLYLKGEGVSKNCDQARVLLDSAARAGMKQAGERLRYLQAFGCE
jgi:hypothetical protein